MPLIAYVKESNTLKGGRRAVNDPLFTKEELIPTGVPGLDTVLRGARFMSPKCAATCSSTEITTTIYRTALR